MKIDGNQIKVGNILEIQTRLWRVLKTQHTQPGKGGAYIQVELKDIKDGTKTNERFRSSESVERIILEEKNFQFLYKSNGKFHFMDNKTYEQLEIGNEIISENQEKFLIENETIIIQIYETTPISIVLPDTIALEVIEADAVVKGQTAASSYKPALLDRNIKTSVPPFIEVGDKIVINTNDNSYAEKAKN